MRTFNSLSTASMPSDGSTEILMRACSKVGETSADMTVTNGVPSTSSSSSRIFATTSRRRLFTFTIRSVTLYTAFYFFFLIHLENIRLLDDERNTKFRGIHV